MSDYDRNQEKVLKAAEQTDDNYLPLIDDGIQQLHGFTQAELDEKRQEPAYNEVTPDTKPQAAQAEQDLHRYEDLQEMVQTAESTEDFIETVQEDDTLYTLAEPVLTTVLNKYETQKQR